MYCTCGFKTEYSGAKPKFCGGCGKAFNALFAFAAATTKPVASVVPTRNEPMGLYVPSEGPIADIEPLDSSKIRVDGGSDSSTFTVKDLREGRVNVSRSNGGLDAHVEGMPSLSEVTRQIVEQAVGGVKSQPTQRSNSRKSLARRIK